MTDAPTLARAFRDAVPLFTRFLAGFNDDNRAAQSPENPNHAAWTMGHLALYLHRGADAFHPLPLPPGDFIENAHAGDHARFATESVCFGSQPTPDPALYPTWDRCLEIFHDAADRFADTLERATPDQLAAEVQWGASRTTGAALATRHIVHVATHAGQIIDLRRALAFPRVVG